MLKARLPVRLHQRVVAMKARHSRQLHQRALSMGATKVLQPANRMMATPPLIHQLTMQVETAKTLQLALLVTSLLLALSLQLSLLEATYLPLRLHQQVAMRAQHRLRTDPLAETT